jgi:hypothetical protein
LCGFRCAGWLRCALWLGFRSGGFGRSLRLWSTLLRRLRWALIILQSLLAFDARTVIAVHILLVRPWLLGMLLRSLNVNGLVRARIRRSGVTRLHDDGATVHVIGG